MVYKKGLCLVLLLLSFWAAKAQCSTETSVSNNGIDVVHQAKFEILLKNVGDDNNGDATRGWVIIQGRLLTVTPTKGDPRWRLQVIISTGLEPGPEIVPREVVLYFMDGSELTLDADLYEQKGRLRSCIFFLNKEDIIALKRPIREIDVIDTRLQENNAYQCTPEYGLYTGVLAEQVSCLQ